MPFQFIYFSGCYHPHFTAVGIKSATGEHFDALALYDAVSADGFSEFGRGGCPPASGAADGLVGKTRLPAAVVLATSNSTSRTSATVLHCRRALPLRCTWQPWPQV
jgi:hypothetical protein